MVLGQLSSLPGRRGMAQWYRAAVLRGIDFGEEPMMERVSERGRSIGLVLVSMAVALGVVGAVWGLTIPRVVMSVVGVGLFAFAVSESPAGPSERPARSWPQDESGQGG